MTYSDIYSQALTYTGETASSTAVSDFSDRADYLFPGVVARFFTASAALGASPDFPSGKILKTDTFPLDDRLAPAAAALLASFLVAAEQPELSVRLKEVSESLLRGAMPAESSPTVEVY